MSQFWKFNGVGGLDFATEPTVGWPFDYGVKTISAFAVREYKNLGVCIVL